MNDVFHTGATGTAACATTSNDGRNSTKKYEEDQNLFHEVFIWIVVLPAYAVLENV